MNQSFNTEFVSSGRSEGTRDFFTRSASCRVKIPAQSSVLKDSLARVTLSKNWENLFYAKLAAAGVRNIT